MNKHHSLAREQLINTLIVHEGITTSDGDVGGTNLIDAALIGVPNDYFSGKTIVIMDGDAAMEDAAGDSFNSGTGEVTFYAALSAQIVAGVRYRVLNISTVKRDVLSLIDDMTDLLANVGDASGDTLTSLRDKLGDLAQDLATILGTRWDVSGDLGTDIADLLKKALAPISRPVTTHTDTNNDAILALAGLGDNFFKGWYLFAAWDAGGAAAAPQGEYRLVTGYTSVTGNFVHNSFSADLAVTDIVTLIPPVLYEILTIRGGAETLQSIKDDLDTELDLARNPQSDTIVLDGTEQTLYEESDTVPWEFRGGFIDFTGSAWATGESVTLKMYVKVKSGGSYHIAYQPAAITALPAPVAKFVPESSVIGMPLNNVYGIKITLEQTVEGAGYHTYDHEWFDAKRGS